jgi:hypothetical protein
MNYLLLFFLALTPEVLALKNRIQGYPYAPQPSARKEVRAGIILEIDNAYRETLRIVQSKGNGLQIYRKNTLLLQQKNDSLSLMGSIFPSTSTATMDSSFWENAHVSKEGNLDVVEGKIGGMNMKVWVDRKGRIQKQMIRMRGQEVREVWSYAPETGFLKEIRMRGSQGRAIRILYIWEE